MSRTVLSLVTGAFVSVGFAVAALAGPQPLNGVQMDRITAGQLLVPQAVAIGSSTAIATGTVAAAGTSVIVVSDTTGLVFPGTSSAQSQSTGIATSVGK
jgi:hypothetical protein